MVLMPLLLPTTGAAAARNMARLAKTQRAWVERIFSAIDPRAE
jgi:hypothetical protein